MSKRWVLSTFLIAGCGGSGSPPPTGTVTVAVVRNTAPIAGATVVFHDPDGAVVGRGISDESGVVIGAVPAGGMVTVLDPELDATLITLTGVTPGPARLEVPLDPSLASPPGAQVGTLTIPAPAGAPPTGMDHVAIETGCGTFTAPTLPATVPITADCITAVRSVPVIVTAWEPPGSLEHPGDALAGFAGLALAPNSSDAFALPGGTWGTDCAVVDIETDPLMSVQLQTRLGGLELRSSPVCQVTQPATGYAYPTYDFGEGITVNGFAYPAGQSLRGEMFRTRYDDVPTMLAIREADDLLVGDVDMTGFDGNGATWTTDPALADADMIMAVLAWGVTEQQRYVTWKFILPGDATAVGVPELPDDVATWPALGTAFDHVAEIRWHDTPWLAGFDSVEHALPAILDPQPRVLYQPSGTSLRWYRELFYPDAQ